MHEQLKEGFQFGIITWLLTLVIIPIFMYFNDMTLSEIGFFLLIGGPIFLVLALGIPFFLHRHAMKLVEGLEKGDLLGQFTFSTQSQGKLVHSNWAFGKKTRSFTYTGFKVVKFGTKVILYGKRYSLLNAEGIVKAEVEELPNGKLQFILEQVVNVKIRSSGVGRLSVKASDRFEIAVPADHLETAKLLAERYCPK